MIKFGGSGVTDTNQNIFFAKDITNVFSIGRGNDNNIKINSNTISRKQTRFRFNIKYKSQIVFIERTFGRLRMEVKIKIQQMEHGYNCKQSKKENKNLDLKSFL